MKNSPERIILAVALVVLALGAAALAYFYPTTLEEASGVSGAPAKQTSAPKIKPEEVSASMAPWTTPPSWSTQNAGNSLFISPGFFFFPNLYPAGDYIKKDDGTARTPGGVLISWYRKYSLDFTDANIDRNDADGDGFSNKVEFTNEAAKAEDSDGSKSTNPIDAQSHPTFLSRLRLQKYDSRPFRIEFRGYQQLNGENVFQLYLRDVPSAQQPRLKKTGDQLGIEGYVVGPFKQNIVDVVDPATHLKTQVDESTLELDKPEIDFKIPLTFRKEIDSPESTANFVMLMPSEKDNVIKVPRSQTFSPPFLTSVKYLLLQVDDSGAIIRDTSSHQDIKVPKLGPTEWDDVPLTPPTTPKAP